MVIKLYIKKKEDSLYFGYFLKVVNNDTIKIRGVWIKLRKLKYTYTEDGTTQSFRDAKSLKAGKYTVELVGENKDEELEPVAGTKIWASYDIYVKSPDDLRHHIRHMSCQLDKLM